MLEDFERVSFAEWLIELNACAVNVGYKGGPLAIITGQLEWYQSYIDGLTPPSALDLSAQDGKELGKYYDDPI